MGMSASQMRYCLLTGRKSDVEYQGQQINQQRTTLATETSTMNSQLLTLSVPTPPSSDQYTKTAYTYEANGETRTITGTQFKTAAYTVGGTSYDANTYIVNYTTDSTTSKGKSSGASNFSSAAGDGKPPYQTSNGTTLSLISSTDDTYQSDLSNMSLIAQDCGIKDSAGRSYGDAGYTMPTFYKYASGNVTKYVTADDLSKNTLSGNSNSAISTYYVDENATTTQSSQVGGCQVNWNESNRMTSFTDAKGNTYALSTTSTNDQDAYDQAYNQYEYDKSVYDKEMDDINAKICIIESQDKKLELKLKDLDTQQEALNTELDSVKKVVDKNIEQSFKAFA